MALGIVGSAVADVVPIQGSPVDAANGGVARAERWSTGTNDPDPFGELVSAETVDADAQSPLLRLMGMPAQRMHREKQAVPSLPGLAEPAAANGLRAPGRLPNASDLDDPDDADDGALLLGRTARDLLEGMGGASGSPERDGVHRRVADSEAPPADAPPGAAEVRSSPLREGLFLLRAHREWVLVGMLTMLGAVFGLRHFGQATGAAKPRKRKPARRRRLAS
jgi:hypothetical protein